MSQERRCPVCEYRLITWRYNFPRLMKLLGKHDYISCPSCDWNITLEEMNRRGGLRAVRWQMQHRTRHRGHRRPRHRRHYIK